MRAPPTTVPTVGRIVHYWPGADQDAKTNGNEGPVAAVITRVKTEMVVNLLIFRDGAQPIVRTSVMKMMPDAPKGRPAWDWPHLVEDHRGE